MSSTARLLQVFSKRPFQSVSTRRCWQSLLLVLLFTPHLDAAFQRVDSSNEIEDAPLLLRQLQQDHHDGDNIVGTSFLRTQDSKLQRGSGIGTRRVGEGDDAGTGGAPPTGGGSPEAKAKNEPQPPASAPDAAASSKDGPTAPVTSAAASVPDPPLVATPPGDNGPKPTEGPPPPPPSRKATEAPVAKPTKPDSRPMAEPKKDAENSPVKAPSKAAVPDPATDPAPKPVPVAAPVEARKPEPVPAPVEPPVTPTAPVDDDDVCNHLNLGCTGCKYLAKSISEENPDATCRWVQDLESCQSMTTAEAADPVVCDGEPTEKPVQSPVAKPPMVPGGNDEVDESSVGDEAPLVALGVLMLLIAMCCYRRCGAPSRSNPSSAMAHNPALGKYQAVYVL